MEDANLIREEHLQRLISLLRASYTHLVLDLSKSFTSTDMTALRMADLILLVAQLDLTSLRNVVRMLASLGADEAMANKVQIILNRIGIDTDISLKKAEETIGKPIFWQIPNEPKPLVESRNHGLPLLIHAPKCKVQQGINALAEAVCGKHLQPAAKEKSSRWGLFFSRR